MSYFSAQLGSRPLPAPQDVVLWPDEGGWRVAWGQPPMGVKTVQIVRGDALPYAVVASAPAPRRWWLLPKEGGSHIGVAWMRGDEVGQVSIVKIPTTEKPDDAHHLCPLCRQPLEWKARHWQCGCGACWVSQFGQLVDVATLPRGLCTCCAQAQPLLQADGKLLCPVTQQPYAPPLTDADILKTIDDALYQNQAKVGLFGLFTND